MNVVIPDPDPAGLPAPVALLKTLLVFTFILHLLPMNLVLGGSLVTTWNLWRGLGARRTGREEAARRHFAVASSLSALLPAAAAFTVTLGIAPLLFVQVLYGQLFYTSSVLVAWSWLGVILLTMIGYYGFYGLSLNRHRPSPTLVAVGVVSALAFVKAGFVFTNNLTLMLRPDRFYPLYQKSALGLHLNLDDPMLWPRYLHFVVAAVATTGLALAIIGRRQARKDAAAGAWIQSYGVRLFVGATVFQLFVGLWFLSALPAAVRASFLGGNGADTAMLWGAVALGLLAVVLAPRNLWVGVGLIGVTLTGMAVVRHRVRTLVLEPHFSTDTLAVRPQTVVFLLFAVLLVVGLAVVAWMAVQLARGKASAMTDGAAR
jgi:hypothetical protein